MYSVKKITSKEARGIFKNPKEHLGKYYLACNMYVGIDNSSGDAWTEEFDSLYKCLKWLRDDRLISHVKVYNNDKLSAIISLGSFLRDNQDVDGYIAEKVESILTNEFVEFECFNSGKWKIVKI